MNKRKKKLSENTIARQYETIERLTQQVKELEIDNQAKEEIEETVDILRQQLVDVIDELKDKSRQYDEILEEMTDMKNVLKNFIFTNRR